MLTSSQLKVLRALEEHGEVTEKRLMALASIGGPQGTSALCRTLMARGLIERDLVNRGSDLDSFYRYRITPAGREAQEKEEA